jgi:hypothetical protein
VLTPTERRLLRRLLRATETFFTTIGSWLTLLFHGKPSSPHRVWVYYPKTGHYELHISYKQGDRRQPF